MGKWNDNKSYSLSFSIPANEKIEEYIRRVEEESKDREEAFKERIIQLFDEHVTLEGMVSDEVYESLSSVFSIGYQLGWNDHYYLYNNKED